MGLEGVRVLLVEDESLIAMSVEDMLYDLGCSLAATAASVDEALEKVGEGGFDFALLDINLRGREVFPVADLLAERGVPFAFASGYGAAGLPPAFRDRAVVSKPFKMNDLSVALSAALDRKA